MVFYGYDGDCDRRVFVRDSYASELYVIETVWVGLTWPQAIVTVILGLPLTLAISAIAMLIVLGILSAFGIQFGKRG